MEAMVVTPKEFAAMMKVSETTARALMERIPEHFNVGLGGRKSFRLPLEAAMSYAQGRLVIPSEDGKPIRRKSSFKGKKNLSDAGSARHIPYRK